MLHHYMLFFDHPRSGMVYNFGRVCLSDDNFRKPWHRKFILVHPVYLQGIRVRFVYEGHRVKVTGAKRSKIPIPEM